MPWPYGNKSIWRWWAQRLKKPDVEVEELPESNVAPADEHSASEKLQDEWAADRATERD